MIYKILVIGCGHIGEEHLKDIYYRENIEIAAVVDWNEELARLTARKYGAKAWGNDYKSFLNDKQVDIAIVATNANSHLSILKDCLAAGVHVLCEKPIATNLKDAEEFVAAAKASEAKVLVGHILRHNETFCKVGEMIRADVIGHPIVMRMVQNHHAKNWPRYKRLMEDCPPIVDCGVHYFDIMQWYTGEKIVQVGGMKASIDLDTPEGTYNYGLVTVKLSGSSVGYYEAGWSNTVAAENLKEFIGPKGRISITLSGNRVDNREEGDLITCYHYPEGTYETINVQAQYKPTYRQLEALIGMIEGGEEASPTLDEVYSSFKVALTADQALREERVIKI